MALITATQIIPDVSFITAHVSYSKTELFSLPGADAPRVHVSALTLCYQYPSLSGGGDRVGGRLHGDKECPFSDVTSFGRVWRKVPESETWSVGVSQTPSTGLRLPSFSHYRI